MKTYLDDPVLNLTASALRLIRWLMLAFTGFAILAFIAIAVSFFVPGATIVKPGQEYVAVLMVAGAAMLFLTARFFKYLRDLILSVRDGQPLTVANAARLRSMGWLTLVTQLVMLITVIAVGWQETASAFDFDLTFDIFESLIITAVLFILARVFEQGARMQEELEGTV